MADVTGGIVFRKEGISAWQPDGNILSGGSYPRLSLSEILIEIIDGTGEYALRKIIESDEGRVFLRKLGYDLVFEDDDSPQDDYDIDREAEIDACYR